MGGRDKPGHDGAERCGDGPQGRLSRRCGGRPHAIPRHARACPGHPRRAAAGPVSERAAAVRRALRNGPAWVAGTSPAMTARNDEGDGPPGRPSRRFGGRPHALPRHARACPGHPRRAAAGPVPERAAAVRRALRNGPAWVAGTSPAMTVRNDEGTGLRTGCRAAAAVVLTPARVMPGPVPGTHAVPRPDRSRRRQQPFGAPCGTGRRGWPDRSRGAPAPRRVTRPTPHPAPPGRPRVRR